MEILLDHNILLEKVAFSRAIFGRGLYEWRLKERGSKSGEGTIYRTLKFLKIIYYGGRRTPNSRGGIAMTQVGAR